MSCRRAQLPLTVTLPLVGGLVAVIPAVLHDDDNVRRIAVRVSLALLGIGALGLLIHVRHWLTSADHEHEKLLARVDSWGALGGFLDEDQELAASIERRPRRRLLRSVGAARDHAGTLSATAVGVVVAAAVLSGASQHDQPDRPDAAPNTPADQVPESTPPSPIPETAAALPATTPARTVAARPSARPTTVTKTIISTVAAPAADSHTDTLPLGLLSAPPSTPERSDPPAAVATAPPSSTPSLVSLDVGHG